MITITIEGPQGSGKTLLAKKIARACRSDSEHKNILVFDNGSMLFKHGQNVLEKNGCEILIYVEPSFVVKPNA